MQQEDRNAIFQMRFPQKLWYLLNMHTEAILWGRTGRTILLNYRILYNYLQCEHSIFKTTNISSFVRQLNLYGFRKVTSHLQDPLCNSCNPFMHEYVHEYFQYGRPEYINKITRKALAMKKSFKPKSIFNRENELLYLTPLQKARRNLREALRKAVQDLITPNSPTLYQNFNFENEDLQDELCGSEEYIDLDWLNTKSCCKSIEEIPNPDLNGTSKHIIISIDNTKTIGNTDQEDSLIAFQDTNKQRTENFSASFLSMPDLDPEPHQDKTGAELLAEFNIDHEQSIMNEVMQNKENVQNSLNCVLPSINNDSNDDVSMERDYGNLSHYNGEWDQMFNDIIINKVNSQDSSTDLKELYSQISRTIDLLND